MTVHFIGAGPGAPDLITVRGQNLVQRCPVCLYAGSLVPREIVALCPQGARVIDTAPLDLDAITAEFVAAHQAGYDVARLHSGDLSVWSAMGEQIRRLEAHGIDYTVTPGVPSFAAAAAALKRELTLPEVAQTLVLTRTPGRASSMRRAKRWPPMPPPARRWRSICRSMRSMKSPPRCSRITAPTARSRWWSAPAGRSSASCRARCPPSPPWSVMRKSNAPR